MESYYRISRETWLRRQLATCSTYFWSVYRPKPWEPAPETTHTSLLGHKLWAELCDTWTFYSALYAISNLTVTRVLIPSHFGCGPNHGSWHRFAHCSHNINFYTDASAQVLISACTRTFGGGFCSHVQCITLLWFELTSTLLRLVHRLEYTKNMICFFACSCLQKETETDYCPGIQEESFILHRLSRVTLS